MSLLPDIKRIEATCVAGESVTGLITLNISEGDTVSFMIRCSHRRIMVSTKDYSGRIGEDGILIRYEISSFGFDPGTVFKGFISIVSNQGEEKIPVILSVVRDEILSSRGPVRNLFHFTNLAKEDFEEAANLFYTEEARRIFQDGDRETFFKYRAFSSCQGRGRKYEGVEEFLVETGKKNPVILSFAEPSVMEREVYEDREILITVRKSGWGYPGFELSATDDFIILERNEYGIEDFEGNFAEVKFKIASDRLHAGHNFGRIELRSLHSAIHIPVFVDMTKRLRDWKASAVRQIRAKLVAEFLNFRIGDISGEEWIARSTRLIEKRLMEDRNDPESRLMQAQLLLAAKRYSEADIVLAAVEREIEENECSLELGAYYIYLRAMCDRDDRSLDEAVRVVWDLYNRSGNSWRILWILIYLDERIKMSPEREKALIEEQVMRGVRSPLLYLEAYSVLSHDPMSLRKLSDFELNVLSFAVKKGLLKKELAEQVSILSQRVRGYDPRIIRILSAYYNEFKDDDILKSICSYLIRNDITDSAHAVFFEKGVERDLGVTNLYDYYLYTMKRSSTKLLPKNVLMYYSMKNDLPPAFRSYVYANMIVNEEEAKLYLSQSIDACTAFAASEVRAGHMDENLAIIVDHLNFFRLADKEVYDVPELQKEILQNGFIRLILIDDPRIKNVIVVEDAFKEERFAKVSGGRAYLGIYDNDHELFFEDEDGRRFGQRYISCEELRLLRVNELFESMDPPEISMPGLWVALSEKGRSYISVDDKNYRYVRKIIESPYFNLSFKDGLLTSLLRYYFDNDMQPEMEELLQQTDVKKLTMEERNEYVRFCSMRDDDREAYKVIGEYGSYGMDPRVLMRVSTQFIEEGAEPDPVLLEIASSTFRSNKYNEEILNFISRYYEGTIRDLRDIWIACRDFDADPGIIEGRLLEQMLATGAYVGERDEIFFDYLKRNPAKKITGEYFRRMAEDNFLKDTLLDDRLYMGLLDFAIDEEITDLEALCLIRFFVQRRDMRSDRILYPYIRSLAERDIIFDFFLYYSDLIPALKLFADNLFVDYRTEAGRRVIFNYCLEEPAMDNVVYRTMEMRELYPGVYQARGTVFPGEVLQYYITVDGKGHTRSDIEVPEERFVNGDGRYEILQDALTCLDMEDYDSFTELAEDYIIKDRIVREVLWAE